MNKTMLKIFCKYQQTVMFEEQEFQKFTDTVITSPVEKLVSFYIHEQHMENNHPSQTDILYALRISHSTLRKVLKKLIKIGYIKEFEKHDARFTHYQPSAMMIEGFKIYTARHLKTLLGMAAALGNNKKLLELIEQEVNNLLGKYAEYEPYSNMDSDSAERVKGILYRLEKRRK